MSSPRIVLQRIGSELVQRHAQRLHRLGFKHEIWARDANLQPAFKHTELSFENVADPCTLPLGIDEQFKCGGKSP